jgi:hypothetical protein
MRQTLPPLVENWKRRLTETGVCFDSLWYKTPWRPLLELSPVGKQSELGVHPKLFARVLRLPPPPPPASVTAAKTQYVSTLNPFLILAWLRVFSWFQRTFLTLRFGKGKKRRDETSGERGKMCSKCTAFRSYAFWLCEKTSVCLFQVSWVYPSCKGVYAWLYWYTYYGH